jgi:hypothetical protein
VFRNVIKNAMKFTPEGCSITIRTSNIGMSQQPAWDHEAEATADDQSEIRRSIRCSSSFSSADGGGKEEEVDQRREGEEVDQKPRERAIRVEIVDTGIGIEGHAIPHLFRAFEQGDASIAARFGGLGLGLSISRCAAAPVSPPRLLAATNKANERRLCRPLVEMHRGVLMASSAGKNRGSTFTIVLPTIDTTTNTTTAAPRLPGSPGSPLHQSLDTTPSDEAHIAAVDTPSSEVKALALSARLQAHSRHTDLFSFLSQ